MKNYYVKLFIPEPKSNTVICFGGLIFHTLYLPARCYFKNNKLHNQSGAAYSDLLESRFYIEGKFIRRNE